MYFTSDNGFRALKIMGSTNYTDLVISGVRFEGRNAHRPALGALITVTGGNVKFNDSWISYGMTNPAAYSGAVDQALLQVFGGDVIIDGARYDRAAGVSQDVPFAYVGNGASLEIARVRRGTLGGTWTALPAVRAVYGANVRADTSVRLV